LFNGDREPAINEPTSMDNPPINTFIGRMRMK
jgi:hypothetical protein